MAWIVQDNPASIATAIRTAVPVVTPAKRSNAKRKKSAAPSTSAQNEEDTLSSSSSTTTMTNANNRQSETQEESKKVLSKSQRKRARHHGSINLSEEEKNWSKTSLFNVPELPSKPDTNLTTHKKNKGNKKVASKKKGDQGEIVLANYGNLDDWGWTPVETEGMLMDDMEGFLGLEELDGIEVDYEGTEETGRTIVFKHNAKAAASKTGNGADGNKGTKDEEPKKSGKKEIQRLKLEELKAKKAAAKAAKAELKMQEEPKKSYNPMEGVNPLLDISAWKDFTFSPMIENAFRKLKFTKPSPIQAKALPLGLAGRDVVGVAETGSGKTLAFGLPIIQLLAQQAAAAADSNTPLKESLTALILTPTRELAIQVREHLAAFTQFTGHHVVPIVGGMSVQKQIRQMDRNPAIIVATPGRLWELISTNPTYSERLIHVRFLVLDEADRMLESGHFQELSNILQLLDRKREVTSEWEQHVKANEANEDGTVTPASIARTDYDHDRQTFVFTATLSKELSLNLSRKKNYAQSAEQGTEGSMEALMERIDFHDESPAFVSIVSDKIVTSNLLEAKIDCLTEEKDLYLYYVAKKYPGRTLVFVNSIDALRHLVPMMQLLGVDALGMHAQMQQRQRLKNLDRFKSNPHALMIASDVAARGLDIPMVNHVIHYQVPRSGDIYVHRSGRTARAENEGISLLLCGPDEVQLYRKICVTLNKDNGITEFPVEHSVLTEMKKRVALAKKIDEQEHRIQKAAHQDDWMRKSAEAMDIILDEDMLSSGPKFKNEEDDIDSSAMTARKNKIKSMRAELKAMLQKPLMPKGASAKYITSGSIRDLADRLRNNTNHNPSMPAHVKTTALEDIKAHRKNNS
ncbi:ATP-dependent RNA helicase [Modicella reniformis]|uniref:ATP-dependent RNA helicase n=1 Tax=Modicella reniformis TaxID=1440133 RepID=A0A9P6M9K3_9FUNG|nr:ATP-dependent RNA helicase [Modicella reniformis]